jgi:hypothetical protein
VNRARFWLAPPTPTPNTFDPANPSKEYIYAGGRLVATEVAASLPAAPTNLAGGRGCNGPDLSWGWGWQDNSNNETGFRVERSMDGVNFSTLIILPANTTELLGDIFGTIRIRAMSSHGDSAPSNVAQIEPCPECDAQQACDPEAPPRQVIWVDDHLPQGASPTGSEAWNWVSSSPAPFSQQYSNEAAVATEFHQQYFQNATETLSVNNETLIAHVYLDSANPPSEIMLQWNDGTSWEHRAYWGANNINLGTDGTASRQRLGDLPESGVWVRLEIAADQVGLQGKTLTGLALSLYGGRASWDYIGKSTKPPAGMPAPPTNLTATGFGSPNVSLSWTASSSAIDHYQIERKQNINAAYTVVANATGTTFNDTSVSTGTSYLYRVCAVDAVGHHSPCTMPNLATTVTFYENPLVAGVTTVKAQHVYDLRQAVNAVRSLAGLSAATWTDSSLPGVTIKAIHLEELRSRLDEALNVLGLPAGSYTDASLSGVTIKKVHTDEIRQRVN